MRLAAIQIDCKNTPGESCFWDPRMHFLWWTDIERSCVYSYLTSGAVKRYQLPGRAGFILPRRTPGFILGFSKQLVLCDQSFTNFRIIHTIETGTPETRINDAVVDPWGGVVFGTFDESPEPRDRRPIAHVYRLAPDGSLRLLFSEVTVSNGLAFSPDHRIMYFADTPTKVVRRFVVASNFQHFEEISPLAPAGEAAGYPDGAVVDAAGNYWSARVWGGCVICFSPEGQIVDTIAVPVKGPTCLTFAGAESTRLYITSLRTGHTPQELQDNPQAGGIFTANVATRGQKQLLCAF